MAQVAAMVQVPPPTQKLPCATGMARKTKRTNKRKNKKKKTRTKFPQEIFPGSPLCGPAVHELD